MAHSILLEKPNNPIEMSDLFSYAAISASLAGLFISVFVYFGNYFISAFASDICSRIVDGLVNSLSILGFRSNKSLMLFARDLRITESNNPVYWKWVRLRETTFTEAAELLQAFSLEIMATTNLNFDKLSPETKYVAHLIFKTTANSKGLDTRQVASVSVGSVHRGKAVCIKPRDGWMDGTGAGLPVERSDGWMELELGKFGCDDGTGDQEVVVSLTERDEDNEKSGLIVAAIELRPI